MTSENGRDLDMRLAAAAAVAREAGRLARRYFERRSDLTVEVKGPQDLVSVADRAVEDLIRSRLATLFPEDAVVGEEASGLEQIADDPKDQKREFALKIKDLERRPVHVEPEFALAAERVWVVDPIDGTQNFLRGLPWFGVVLALLVDGRTELGVIYDPNTDELYTARRGHGAFLNGEPIRVSECTELSKAVIGVGHSPRHAPHLFLEPFTQVVEAGAQTRNLLTAALQLAHVACGRLDATWDPYLLPWDVLAGILLVIEAGGAAAPYQLRPDFSGGAPLLAGSAALVDALRPLITDRTES